MPRRRYGNDEVLRQRVLELLEGPLRLESTLGRWIYSSSMGRNQRNPVA
jgi:hypothetical protein